MSKNFLDNNPHLADFLPYIDLLNQESPRGKVLISCGFLEELLKKIILAFLLDSKISRELLDAPNAPLSTFSSRSSACFALSLITENEHHDLNLLRKIRNDFAHDIHTTFETPSVVDRCKLLRLKAPDYIAKENRTVIVPPLGQFSTCSVALILNLNNRPHYVAKQRRTVLDWPT